MKSRAFLILLLLCASLLKSPYSVSADTATSSHFKVETGVIDAGGGNATSTTFDLRTSLGQPAPGISTSTTFRLRGGFLNFPAPPPAVSPPPPPPPPPPVQVGGGAAFFVPSGEKPKPVIPGCPSVTVDLNCDNRVDFIDLSILLYYYGMSGPTIGMYDFDGDGTVDFPDISIMMYYWTG